jgi:regulator of RNase E activity RraB
LKKHKTKINEVDFENLQFDLSSLIICWNAIISMDSGKICYVQAFTVLSSTRSFCKSFSLWSSYFEGMKAYEDNSDVYFLDQ